MKRGRQKRPNKNVLREKILVISSEALPQERGLVVFLRQKNNNKKFEASFVEIEWNDKSLKKVKQKKNKKNCH